HGVRRAEECNERDAERIGEVHAAGVIGHEKLAGLQPCDVGGQVGLACEVFHALCRESLGNGSGDRTIVGRSEEHETFVGQRADERAPMCYRPALLRIVFGTADEADALARTGWARERSAVQRRVEAEVTKEGVPQSDLVVFAFVETSFWLVRMRQ